LPTGKKGIDMRGGNSKRRHCASRIACAALIGMLALLGKASTPLAQAAELDVDDNCNTQRQTEQSILVASRERAPSPVDFTADRATGKSLEPIANVSEYEPDLADPEVVAAVPELADPPPQKYTAKAADRVLRVKPDSEVLSFKGITPGISHRRDVFRQWGDPRSESTTATTLMYRFEKMRSVRVQFDGNVVDAIVVTLDRPLSTDELTSRLGLESIRPAILTNKAGVAIAQVYPERGVAMRLARADHEALAADEDDFLASASDIDSQVLKVVIQPIKAGGFLLRAENNRRKDLTLCLEDLEQALTLDRTLARVQWLLSDIYLSLGKVVTAERFIAEAIEMEPRNHLYRLQYAKCLRQLARYDVAVEETRKVLEAPGTEPLVRALALHEMGLLAALGSREAAHRSVPLHTKAIEIADKLAASKDAKVSQLANELLVEAHLATAVEIARGDWEQKDKTVPKWIERASALSEEMIAADPTNLPLRLQVAVSALAAAASFDQPIDPLLWVEEAEETARYLKENSVDELVRDQYDWQLGLAYFQAAQIEHRRSDPKSAERLGDLADLKLSGLAKGRDEMPDTGYLLGRLYFQIGAVHAVHYEDHVTACRWYDQAADLLLDPVPVTTMAAPQQHGDALVSMGVSYWQTNRRERAIELTEAGVELVEEAVESGLLKRIALNVPYSNLSAMYEAQGEPEPAAKYSKLARKSSGVKVSSKPSKRRRR